MNITVNRKYKKKAYTIGKMYLDGEYFCDTLEDTDRGLLDTMSVEEVKFKKVYGKTAIPRGTYSVEMTYSPKFKRKMPLLGGVKGFSAIRIHNGANPSHTYGCVLVGKNTVVGGLTASRQTSDRLNSKISKALDKGEKVTITIK